ncbi:hypothetical protein QQZ08_007067 [Neonectria magnoliae]|uniref:Uncharacterized protein n=1 Tax=Neonectria magnoliae TaxID=2732573 RepID=A0ABR1I0H5_9HYPO
MPTREVVSQFAQAESQALGEGPVQDSTDPTPQSLLDKHHNLAARPNNAAAQNFAPSDNGTLKTEQHRTGAQTSTTQDHKPDEATAVVGKMDKDAGSKKTDKGGK